jgi:hypothetical protein
MRKFFTLILSVMFVFGAYAQLERPTAVIKKTTVKPKIDGVFDDVWATTDSLSIERPYKTTNGLPTLGEPGETYWKALWDEDGFYLIINVTDDAYYPNYVRGSGNAWDNDKIEVYFDVNYVLEDGAGPSTGNSGHHQMAPDMSLAKEDGVLNTEGNGRQHAFKVSKPNYVAEYFVPWVSLKDKEGITVDKSGVIGFDVTVNDSDPSDGNRRRGVWAHSGEEGSEAWSNMDHSGTITFEGAEPGQLVESVKLTGGSITTNNGTLQIVAEILPEDATDKTLIWTVKTKPGSSGRATISSTGVVTAILDGVVIVEASSGDGSFIDADAVEVTISGQKPTIFGLSYLKNGDFNNVTATGGIVDWTVPASAAVVDGALVFGPDAVLTNQWDYTLLQRTYIPFELKDMDFIISFKAWADEPRTLPLVLEDAYNDGAQWDAYVTSSDPSWSDKTWTVNLTTVPTVYSIVVNAGIMKATTQQNFNFQVGKETPKIHLDSIYMISVADMNLVYTKIAQNSLESFKVYPNPAVSKLYVELTTANSTVAIYNSVGVKMEETIVNGTRHEFDVSRYTKGLYFVKANNKVVKFVK